MENVNAISIVNTWLPPAIIIGVMITFISAANRSLNKRIDDFRSQMTEGNNSLRSQMTEGNNSLRSQMIEGNNSLRSQMTREHDAFSKKVDTLTEIVTKHITDYSIHDIRKNTPE